MPDAPDKPVHRFRRVGFIAAAIALLLFVWTIWLMIHFNAAPASVKFSAKGMLNVASVSLPGPLLLAFLAWQAKYRFCRIAGWIVLPLVLLATGMPAALATVKLRPPFAPGTYDAAIKEAESNLSSLVSNDADRDEFQRLSAAFNARPQTVEAIRELADRATVICARFEARNTELHRYRQTMEAPFDTRAVSPARRDEYLRLVLQPADMPAFLTEDDKTTKLARQFEQRLRLLADNGESWSWTKDGTLAFHDEALKKAYDELRPRRPNPEDATPAAADPSPR